MNRRLLLAEETLARFCEQHHIRRLSLFGSQLKSTDRPDSEVDLLVEFDPEHIPGLLQIAGMEIELSDMLGKKVDLRTAGDLSRYFRDEVRMAEVCTMHDEDRVRLRHMLEACEAAIAFVGGRQREDLRTDQMLQFAVSCPWAPPAAHE